MHRLTGWVRRGAAGGLGLMAIAGACAGRGSVSAKAPETASPEMVARPIQATAAGYGLWLDEARAPGIADNTVLLREFLATELTAADRQLFTDVLPFVRAQIDHTAADLRARDYPLRTDPKTGEWETTDGGYWTAGHWVGLLWQEYQLSGDARYARMARDKAAGIYAEAARSAHGHDHGFLFGLSHVMGMPLVDAQTAAEFRTRALVAAATYTTKMDPVMGLVHWHNTHEENRRRESDISVIDSMMNVPFMWWASEQSGEPRFRAIGLRQAEGIRKYAVRPDFSTAHGVEFDPRHGTFLRQHTVQGYADNSTWTRGHSWGIYGFTVVYAKTGDKSWLVTARGLADYYLNHPKLTPDLVPVWDFDDPDPHAPRDTSAAACVASGLQELARFEDDPERAKLYMRKSIATLRSLSAPPWLARGTRDQAILLHGCQHFPKNVKDNGLIFGDYYYVEALVRLLNW
jgi:unsaturated chondroitin disaccharide hydrolase